ncbi:KAP family NTPase [Shewanella marinintestina]|uniref:KAP family P-loop NTPase fold protein n=1 Tax=Shewanella marinintestina TaxID=190305 RepID=UPI00200D5975|nr:P-loop NTPase fold protein [Shewanella marinintestina]MCL1147874.1 KAP family NTPase [Shewanella marinintestina]
MEFKSHKVIVESENPFKNDRLNRQPHVDNFSTLLENISSPIVLSVNAPWGQGKTTFLEMLHAQLVNKEHNSIYFSAWETDFASDPLQAFLGEINESIEALINGDEEKNKAWETTKKAGSHILRKGLPALIKVGTAGILDAEKIIEDESSKVMEGLTKDFLAEYTKNKEAIAQFKSGVSKVLSNEGGESTRLFIFIDELDRCRPTYAIELLERIKHLLDIEGLVFVLAMDKVQLSHSVKGIYGAEFEAIGYLRRFIDIEYTLPENDLDAFIDQLYINFGFNDFFQKRMLYREFQYDKDHLKDTFKLLAKAKKLSLREVEQLFAKINLVIQSTAENTYLYPALLAFLIIAKEYHYDNYNDYINKGDTPEKLISDLYAMIPQSELLDSHSCALVESFLIGAKYDNYNNTVGNSLKRHEDIENDENSSKEQKRYSDKIVQISTSFSGFRNSISLDSLKQRIEMVESFQFSR